MNTAKKIENVTLEDLIRIEPSAGWKGDPPEREARFSEDELRQKQRHLLSRMQPSPKPGESAQEYVDRIVADPAGKDGDFVKQLWMLQHVTKNLERIEKARTKEEKQAKDKERKRHEATLERAGEAEHLLQAIQDTAPSEKFLAEFYGHMQNAMRGKQAREKLEGIRKQVAISANALNKEAPEIPETPEMDQRADWILLRLDEGAYLTLIQDSRL